jgi:hypothetical protein
MHARRGDPGGHVSVERLDRCHLDMNPAVLADPERTTAARACAIRRAGFLRFAPARQRDAIVYEVEMAFRDFDVFLPDDDDLRTFFVFFHTSLRFVYFRFCCGGVTCGGLSPTTTIK